MKKIISSILTVSMLLSITTVAYAEPKNKPEKPKMSVAAIVKSIQNKKLEKSKNKLIEKCDFSVSQLVKLKGYIDSAELGLTASDAIIVDAKSKIDSEIKLINDSAPKNNINSYMERINDTTSAKELKEISKELQKSWLTNQNFMKRTTGLASAARLNKAYLQTKDLVDAIGKGIDAIGSDAANTLKKEEFKGYHEEIASALEEAHGDYLEAVKLYSNLISDEVKADKNFKESHSKLMDAQKGLQNVLVGAKQLLVKIKNIDKTDDDKLKVDDHDNDESDNHKKKDHFKDDNGED